MSTVGCFDCFDLHILTFLGWGDTDEGTSSDILQKTVVPIVQNKKCLDKMSQPEHVDEDLIVCAGGAAAGPCKVKAFLSHETHFLHRATAEAL